MNIRLCLDGTLVKGNRKEWCNSLDEEVANLGDTSKCSIVLSIWTESDRHFLIEYESTFALFVP